MAKNSNLHKAKKEANNEFYTLLYDIEQELQHYKDHFKDKVVYCNCDDPESDFVKYFKDNYEELGLKGLHHTQLKEDGNGSAFSSESIELLNRCDIVVSPPFSKFYRYIKLAIKHNKQFLIAGHRSKVTNDDELYMYILQGKIFYNLMRFPYDPQNDDKKMKLMKGYRWFTNLNNNKDRGSAIEIESDRRKELMQHYDNTDRYFQDLTVCGIHRDILINQSFNF